MNGDDFIKSWSRTLQRVTLSSAEAELVTMTKVIAEVIGFRQLVHKWGRSVRGRIYANSTVALSIAQTKVSVRLRHINVGVMWGIVGPRKKAQGVIGFKKFAGKVYPTDMMTNNIGPTTLVDLSRLIVAAWLQGRASTNLLVKE